MNQPAWRKSSHSGSGGCVEIAVTNLLVHVRHSKDPDSAVLVFTHPEWAAFIAGAKDGQFDLPEQPE